MDLTAERNMRDAGVRGHEDRDEEMTPDHKLFDKWCRGGDKALNQDEWNQVRNAMSGNPAVDPENGGYTVPTNVATTILDALKAYGGMSQVATLIRPEEHTSEI